jgi:hypothetical protein
MVKVCIKESVKVVPRPSKAFSFLANGCFPSPIHKPLPSAHKPEATPEVRIFWFCNDQDAVVC